MSAVLDNVFLAEDDLDDVEFFAEIVGEYEPPKNLQVAKDGDAFMALLQTAPVKPSIIFLDVNMPRKTGIECLREIRSDQSYKDIPVVIISTASAGEVIEQSYEYGADYYMIKPDTYAGFRSSIKKIFNTDYRQPVDRSDFLISSSLS